MSPFRRLLLNDEGNSALHFVDLADEREAWTQRGPGRDLQLIGRHHVLRSTPTGFIELDLRARGDVVREVVIPDLPGPTESARRLPGGNTVVLGNSGAGVFVWEVNDAGRPVAGRARLCDRIEKGRLLRRTRDTRFLFCSETAGRAVVHELDWAAGVRDLFAASAASPADSMVKAVRIGADVVMVSTGYAASLLRVDVARGRVLQTIGGKRQPRPHQAARELSPFFFSGYQLFADGSVLIANWQGHSRELNGQGYQALRYDADGALMWLFDQARFPAMSSLNNVLALDDLDTARLHDEPDGVLVPVD